MNHGNFIFADLSTYELGKAKDFYSDVFGWTYASEDNEYFVAYADSAEAAGIYETPEKFKNIGMPSFRMTYIQVNNVDEVVALAKSIGGIVELTQDILGLGKIALIRDPLGAGFTVYEGEKLNSRTKHTHATMVWNELFVSDSALVKDFYAQLFGWSFLAVDSNRSEIICQNGKIGAIQQLDSEERGAYQYWGVFFAVDDIEKTVSRVEDNGGSIVYTTNELVCCADFSNEAFFFLIER